MDGRTYREIQSNGAYHQTTYDDANRKTTSIFYSATGTPLATNISEFDRRGNLVKATDAGGFVSTNTYDGLDRVKISAGPPIVTVWEDCGPVPNCGNWATNVLQQKTTYFYDAAGIVATNINALGEKTIAFADALGRPVKSEIRDTNNTLIRVTSTAYSADHHSVTVTNGTGAAAIVSTTYTDTDGHSVLSVAYPNSNLREFSLLDYDLAGNLIYQERDSLTNGVLSTWTANGVTYDGINRPIVKSDRDAAVTAYAYNALGNLTNRTMPGGLQWQARFNNAGQMLEERNLGSGGVATRSNTYAYYASGSPFAGLLQTSTDGRGVACTHTYDDWLRPSANTYDGPLPEHDIVTGFGYDARGFLTGVGEQPTGYVLEPNVVYRAFDAYGQMSAENVGIGGLYYNAAQTWDAAGRRRQLSFGGFANFAYNYSWRADGSLTSVATPVGGGSYNYNSAGILTNRLVGPRNTTVSSLDGTGRPLSIVTKVSLLTKLTETLSWTGDGLLSAHTLAREDFTDSRAYSYANFTRRLTEERLNLNASQRWTNSFTFDNGVASGPGALTKIGPATGSARWTGGVDAFSRVNTETNSSIRRPASGKVNGPATLTASLDGMFQPISVYSVNDATWTNRWASTLEIPPGAHQLIVSAQHPSGKFTTNASVWFTNSVASERISDSFDGAGYLTKRIWRSPSGTTNRTQDLSWDARGRLVKVVERDANNDGFDWSATYDPLGRRMQARTFTVTNGVAYPNWKANLSFFDPLVEFLELGVLVDYTQPQWKMYGPDLNGVYGGLNGTGGFEAVAPGLNQFNPTVSDVRGNILGVVTNGIAVNLTGARPTGYGAASSYKPLAIGFGGDVATSAVWRGRSVDITGFVNLGARHYIPDSGTFLGSDPTWNDRDPNFYSFCGGDPVNLFDPDGRCAGKVGNFIYNGGLAGYGLRELGGYLDNYQTDNAALGAGLGYYGSLVNTFAGMSAPSTYVNGLQGFGNNVSTIYRDEDGGFLPAASYAISGWNVGKVWSGSANINLVTGEPVGDWYQRGATISGGVASTAGIAAGGLGIYNWATAAPASVPPVIPAAGEVLGPEGAGQFVWRPGLGSQETATVVRQGQFVNRMYDSGYAPGAGVSGPMGRSFAPGSGVPTTAAEGIQGRGLGLFYPNNAQQAIIYQATENIPAMSRTSIGGTTPEIVIQPANFPSLQPVQQFPVIPVNTRPWP